MFNLLNCVVYKIKIIKSINVRVLRVSGVCVFNFKSCDKSL